MGVNHWLPKPSRRSREIDPASFHGEEPTLKLMAKYEKFSTVCHLTSCKNARRVIEDNGIDPEIRTFDSPLAKESVKVRSVGFKTNTDTNLRELKKILEEKKRLRVNWLLSLHGDSGRYRTVFVFLYTFGHRRPMLQLWDDHLAK